MADLINNFTSWFDGLPGFVRATGGVAVLLGVGLIADLSVKRLLIKLVQSASRHTAVDWDDILVEHNVFGRLTQVVPAVVVYLGVPLLPSLGDTLSAMIRNVAMAYIALMVTLAAGALLTAGNAIYGKYPVSRDRPIKGFVQVAKIAVYVLGGVVVVATLMAKSPVVLLTGFGAMTAILLLVFRDTILSLVASVQLTSLDMVRVGDWIEMPKFNADGDVIDVALHTIKVQNWDKTITTIPTHKLISESFRNWRGMSQSGGRRIKRSVNVDVNSVRFLTGEEVEKFRGFTLLRDYIERKQEDLAGYNAGLGETSNVNLRRLTNLGTFRAYLYSYLQNHPQIHDGMTLLVRQLQPGETGVPIEIYAFTNTTAWAEYESIQADIFDHVLAQAGEFGLRVFQMPSGADVLTLGRAAGSPGH